MKLHELEGIPAATDRARRRYRAGDPLAEVAERAGVTEREMRDRLRQDGVRVDDEIHRRTP